MIKRKVAVLAFTALIAVQLFVPLYMAWRWEDVLRTGTVFFWETEPVDPYDALRGKYIDLNFKARSGPAQGDLAGLTTVYAAIGVKENGNVCISAVAAQPPPGAYIKAELLHFDPGTGKAFVALPFKRYYLPEDLAQAAETAYRQHAGGSGVAAIRIKDGRGVVEELYLGGRPLQEYLRGQAE